MKTMTQPELKPAPRTADADPAIEQPVPRSEVKVHGAVETATLPQPIPADDRAALIDGMARVLADTYAIYLKTQGYHWSVRGPWFHGLHAQFEAQYQALAGAIDTIAERIRALGGFPPASFSSLARLTSIADERGAPTAPVMLRRLEHDHRVICQTLRAVLQRAEQLGDVVSVDLLTARLRFHEEAAWMLRASVTA